MGSDIKEGSKVQRAAGQLQGQVSCTRGKEGGEAPPKLRAHYTHHAGCKGLIITTFLPTYLTTLNTFVYLGAKRKLKWLS